MHEAQMQCYNGAADHKQKQRTHPMAVELRAVHYMTKGQTWGVEDCNQCNSKIQEAFIESFRFKTPSTQY